MTDEIPEWQKRLESATAAYVLKRTAKNKMRAELAESRANRKAMQHAAKLARLRKEQP